MRIVWSFKIGKTKKLWEMQLSAVIHLILTISWVYNFYSFFFIFSGYNRLLLFLPFIIILHYLFHCLSFHIILLEGIVKKKFQRANVQESKLHASQFFRNVRNKLLHSTNIFYTHYNYHQIKLKCSVLT